MPYPHLRALIDSPYPKSPTGDVTRKEARAALTEIDRLQYLVYMLWDEDPCAVSDDYCKTHDFSLVGSHFCAHDVARQTLPQDIENDPPVDFRDWVAESTETVESKGA